MATPATVVPLHAAASAADAAVRHVFDAQLDAALRLRRSTAAERVAKLEKLRDAVNTHSEAILAAAQQDLRKPAAEAELAEIVATLTEIGDAIRHTKRWMKPRGVWPTRLMLGTSGQIRYEPKGRCLIISPWNYPVYLTLAPLASAIAAGNTVILKPSELTPNFSAVMARLIRETFSAEEVALVEGDATVATALLALPFDHIFFTGSPAIGKLVMAAAAKHLASCTLELGGKCPTIVDASADLKMAAGMAMWTKFANVGQTCLAPDHLYVHESVKDEFLRHAREALVAYYGPDASTQKQTPDLARIVNPRHAARIAGLVKDALDRGAEILAGGEMDEANRYIAPTLLGKVPADAKIMHEEIFGPVLPILPYSDLDAVIAEINARPKPLALYIWSKSRLNIERVLANTSSGGACVNHSVMHAMHSSLPFGGANNSGIGRAHGHAGFKDFSNERSVLEGKLMAARVFFPPYTERLLKLLRFTRRVV